MVAACTAVLVLCPLTCVHLHHMYVHTYVCTCIIHRPTHPAGPVVVTDEQCLSFGNIECGTSATGLLHISNESSVPAVFQVELSHQGLVTQMHIHTYIRTFLHTQHTFDASLLFVWPIACEMTVAIHVVTPSLSVPHLVCRLPWTGAVSSLLMCCVGVWREGLCSASQ